MQKLGKKFNVKLKSLKSEEIKKSQWCVPRNLALALICWTLNTINTDKFPIFLHKYGNLAAILPYLTVMAMIITPLMMAELAIGQYSSRSAFSMWKMVPLWTGLTVSSTLVLFGMTVRTLHLTTIAFYYFLISTQSDANWMYCNSWSSERCFNVTRFHDLPTTLNRTNSVQDFFEVNLENSTIKTSGHAKNALLLCAFLPILAILLILDRTLKKLERLLNLLAIIPFLLMLVLLMAAVSYEDGADGIRELMRPGFDSLKDINLWSEALSNNLVVSGLGIGGLVTVASHSHFRTNLFTMSYFVPIFRLLTEILFAAFTYTTFSNYAASKEIHLSEIWDWDTSLLYVKIPLILLEWPGHKFIWRLLYFGYIFLISFRSLLIMIFTLADCLSDTWVLMQRYFRATLFAICALIYCSCALLFNPIGNKFSKILENLSIEVLVPSLVTLQFIALGYIYNAKTLVTDIHFMLNIRIPSLKLIYYLLPIPLALTTGYNIFKWSVSPKKSPCANVLERTIFSLLIIIWLAFFIRFAIKNGKFGIRKTLKPSETWGCFNENDRRNRKRFQSKLINDEFHYRQELNGTGDATIENAQN